MFARKENQNSRLRIVLLCFLLVLPPTFLLAQQTTATSESSPFGYFYGGKYLALEPSEDLVVLSTAAPGVVTFAADQRLTLDPLSNNEALQAQGLGIYRIPTGMPGPQRAEFDSQMLEFSTTSGAIAQPVFEQGQALLIPSDRLIVRFKEDTSLDDATQYFERYRDDKGVVEVQAHRRNTFKLTINNESNGRVYSVCQFVSSLDEVEFAEPDHIAIMLDSPQRPTFELPPSAPPTQSPAGGSAMNPAVTTVTWTGLANADCEGNALPAGWTTGRWDNTFTNAFWNTTTQRSHDGTSSCYATGGGSEGVAAPGDYPNDAFSWLDTPALNLAAFEEVYVEFWFYAKAQDPGWGCSGTDLGIVGVFDPATNVTDPLGALALCHTGDMTADPTTDNGWRRALYRLPPAMRTNGVSIRFVFVSDATTTDEGLYVDEVRIVGSNNVDTEALGNDTYGARHYEMQNSGQIAGLGTSANDMQVAEAWNTVDVSQTLTVAVIDSGVDLAHTDLNLVQGYDPDGTVGGGDRDRHGTAVAGNVGATRDNNLGVFGTAPNVQIMPVYMGGTFSDIADAIDVAVANGADILSNSWGWVGAPSADISSAIQDALDAGVTVLFAAGNGPDRPPYTYDVAFPGNLTGSKDIITVGASSPTDEYKGAASSDGSFTWGSSYVGDGPDVVAPSPWSYSTDRVGAAGYNDGSQIDPANAASADYTCCFGGTSSSTPKTAGVTALMLSVNPNLTPLQVKTLLMGTADDIGESVDKVGSGRVNAYRATVPTVKISTSKRRVRKGEPFDVTVTGTAPFGLSAVWWFGQGTGIPSLDQAHWQNVGGDVVFTHIWRGVTIDKNGTYTLAANARDTEYPNPADGFPHQASEGAGIETTTIRVPLGSTFGLMLLAVMFGVSGTVMQRRFT